MARKWFSLLLLMVLMSLVTGCWDQVQIEERGFVIGVGIDVPHSKKSEKATVKEAPDQPRGTRRFLVTHQLVIPGGMLAGSSSSGGGQNTANEAFLNLTSEGDTLFEVSRELATRSSRSPYYQHLKIVVVSEEMARTKDGFADSLDFFLRDPNLRRGSRVLIAKGTAKSVIEVKPKTEKLPVLYITSVVQNIGKNARMLPPIRIGDVHEQLVQQFSFALPRVTAEKTEVKVAGAAVFSTKNQMIGTLGEEETEGLNFLTGKVKGGMLKAKINKELIAFNIQGAKRSIKSDLRNPDQFKFTIKVECEGVISESLAHMDLMEPKVLSKVQNAFAAEITRLCKDTLQKVHTQWKTDVIGLGSYLKQTHYPLWSKIKNDWEEGRQLYGKSVINVEAQLFIRNIGEVNRTDWEGGK